MFGNYFMQALFRASNTTERQRVLQALAPDISDIACNRNGTYALQSIVDEVHPGAKQEIAILRQALASNVMRTINDDHGTHVIQRFQRRFAAADCDFLFRVASSYCLQMAASSNGVAVLSLVIDRAPRALRDELIDEVVANAIYLSQHPYGNYVVQHLLGGRKGSKDRRQHQQHGGGGVASKGNVHLGGEKLVGRICATLRGNFVALARHKYSSNVIEEVGVGVLLLCPPPAPLLRCAVGLPAPRLAPILGTDSR